MTTCVVLFHVCLFVCIFTSVCLVIVDAIIPSLKPNCMVCYTIELNCGKNESFLLY